MKHLYHWGGGGRMRDGGREGGKEGLGGIEKDGQREGGKEAEEG